MHKTQKPHFPQLETRKHAKNRFCSGSLTVPKIFSARITTFSRAEITYASERVPFDQMKVSGKRFRAKKASTKFDKVLKIKQLLG